LWTPNPIFDSCTIEEHNAYAVRARDGKWYPTWHAPIHRRADGTTCTFGHEHGRNPRASALWLQVLEANYFDANGNGAMDPDEAAVSGLPFGFVNEQLDAAGVGVHRHEDHVGHKVDYANGEPDLATHRMSGDPAGGVWVGKLGNGRMARDTGVRCYYLAKVHQGAHSADAFRANLHEVMYYASCRHRSNAALDQKISLALLVAFGKPGGFTNFMPLCGVARRNDPRDFVRVPPPPSFPAGMGDREIPSRLCIEHVYRLGQGFLVPPGRFSGNLYEAWPASLRISRGTTDHLVSGINLLFDVLDPGRYYNPGAPQNLGFSMELCYETVGNRTARHAQCDGATRYRTITDITPHDPRSAFRGLLRGMYFMPPILRNARGPSVWYTNVIGQQARTTPFRGSVRQLITPQTLNYSTLIGTSIDPRVTLRWHDDGGRTVHLPN
jgi:hypothetical protein